ncbi:MAG: hypothetical protein L0H79_06870 [Intrasporangium sp.]|uniref:hypothetical protein n=1 Tax=Intrasporangium sp. TaxID=1925024 RepID=UPI002647A352|nr:hypothetical protein [Intrasporangium sp.]MDN5795460.1 hypothetical protein [Intrasporangium sp.]
MEIEFVSIKATPAELETPEGRKLMEIIESRARGLYVRADAASSVVVTRPADGDTMNTWVPGVDEEGQATVRNLIKGNPEGDLFREFLEVVASWPDVHAHGIKRHGAADGAPLDFGRYLRLRRQGSRLGGFAYVYASDGICNFRLSYATDEELAAIAQDAWRRHSGHRQYRVNVQIVDRGTLDQAIKLARLAYDAT